MSIFRMILAAVAAFSISALAHSYDIGSIHIDHPWARASIAGQTAGGAFFKLDNKGGADRLVSASTDVAANVELHTMSMDGDVMRMRKVDNIDVPAGKSVALQPGGLHVMLFGLKAPLKAGDEFPLKLKFEKAGEITVSVKVEARDMAPGGHEGMMKH